MTSLPASAQPLDRVTLERGEQHADVCMHQVTVENLRRLFQVSYMAATVYLWELSSYVAK